MRDIASPPEIFRRVRMPFLVHCPLGRIRNKGEDGRGCGAECNGGDIVHRTDANTRRTKLDDMMFEVPVLIGAPLKHALGAWELPYFFQPRINPIFVALIEFTVLTNEDFLELWIGVFIFGLPHIERKSCNEFLTCVAFKHLTIIATTATQTFKGLEGRRRVFKFIISTKLHREDAMRRHIAIASRHIIDKFLPSIEDGVQVTTHSLHPVVVCHIDNGAHIADDIFLDAHEMKLMHAADTLLVAQHAHDVKAWTMLGYAKIMGRIDVAADVIAQFIQFLANHFPCASSIMSREG